MTKKTGFKIQKEHLSFSEKIVQFFKLLLMSFNPKSYLRFSQKRVVEGFYYYLGVWY